MTCFGDGLDQVGDLAPQGSQVALQALFLLGMAIDEFSLLALLGDGEFLLFASGVTQVGSQAGGGREGNNNTFP